MKNHKKAMVLGIGLAMSAASGLASAQDWSGMYGGVNLSQNEFGFQSRSYYGDFFGKDNALGLGLTGGYNIRNGSAVYGVEVDLNVGDFSSSAAPGVRSNEYYHQEAEWSWLSTVRARAGLAVENTLLYVTAGIAAADTDYKYCDNGATACNDGDSDNAFSDGIDFGIAYGFGVEVAQSDAMTVRLEVMKVSLQQQKPARIGDADYPAAFSSDLTAIRLGANWRF
ncbi:MAG: outer membrane protein [Alcanivoracaceae bacterium]